MSYPLLHALEDEVKSTLQLKSQINNLIHLFLKYLKEPRYQSPLTISELSSLFQYFYKDLNSLVITSYTSSNSTKKSLIAGSLSFNDNPKIFDYLLAIANYSTSSIKLLKRTDTDALYQLRVFNYYKFLTIFETIEMAQLTLFNSVNSGEDSLYDKIFRFDEKDIIYQEFLEEKLDLLKELKVPITHFLENDNQAHIIEFVHSLTDDDLTEIQADLNALKSEVTPYSKIVRVVQLHKNLIKLFVNKGFKNNAVNSDVLLPTLIYLIIYKLDNKTDLYLNFMFIKNFVNLLDPYRVELFNVSLGSSYIPIDRSSKPISNKYRLAKLFDLLNLDEGQQDPEVLENLQLTDDFKFYDNDKALIDYILENYLNNGEINYYLTNFEAIITYLSNITIEELSGKSDAVPADASESVDLKIDEAATLASGSSNSSNSLLDHKLLHSGISKLVEEELSTHFQFPNGDLAPQPAEDLPVQPNRSRSSSLLNTISNKLNETRSRSNSSIMNSLKSSNISLSKENFPTLANENESLNSPSMDPTGNASTDNTISLSMMKNILGRISSVSVSQFRNPLEDPNVSAPTLEEPPTPNNVHKAEEETNIFSAFNTPHKRSGSLINRISPNHTRTRSSSLETSAVSSQPTLVNNQQGNKRNSITSKFTSGVSEFMTKLNTTTYPSLQQNVSNSSLQSLENGQALPIDHNDSNSIVNPKRPDVRSRTTSLQIMDKWFNNISANQQQFQQQQQQQQQLHSQFPQNHQSAIRTPLATNNEELDIKELTKFQGVDIESLPIKELRTLKIYYDQLCGELLASNLAQPNGNTENLNNLQPPTSNGSISSNSLQVHNILDPTQHIGNGSATTIHAIDPPAVEVPVAVPTSPNGIAESDDSTSL